VDAYLAGDEGARPFLPSDFRDPAAYRERAREVDERLSGPERRRWSEGVRARGERAKARLDAVLSGEGYVVTTGQQPGLFGGPMYSLYKAVTAACLADALEARLGRPVAPVFWTASEDHDWEEANHTWLVDVDNELRRLTLPDVAGARERPLHALPMGPGVETRLEELAQLLPDTDFAKPYLELVRGLWSRDATLPSAFEATLSRLLEPLGILWVQAHDRWLKNASRSVLLAELESAQAHEEALASRAEDLAQAGHAPQVAILEGSVNLFYDGPRGRERLYRDADGFHLRHSGTALTLQEIRARLDDDPGIVSPNVLLRPVVESAVLPTLAYVAGPGEMNYFAQLEPLFRAHGMTMPVVHPRLGAWVVESKVAKVLEKFDLELEALERPFHDIAGERAREEVPEAIRRALGSFKGTVARGVSELTDAVRDVDPTLKGPVQHVRSVAFDALSDVERKVVQAVKRENEITLQQIEKAHLHLFPEGRPQERVLNPFYYLVRYGARFVQTVTDDFREALPLRDGNG
jgi:bacillithiol biosynthesis cysteine-adding enzyme BshC